MAVGVPTPTSRGFARGGSAERRVALRFMAPLGAAGARRPLGAHASAAARVLRAVSRPGKLILAGLGPPRVVHT